MRSIEELISLKGRVALVTGGAGHIGRCIGAAFAELGATVVLLDRHDAEVQRATADLAETHGVVATSITVDLADDRRVRAVPDEVSSRHGRLDIIVNNAAFVGTDSLPGWTTSVETQDIDTWRKVVEVNLTAPFALVQAAIPALRASGSASVINIGSIYGVVGPDWRLYEGQSFGTPAAYAASKGGLMQMTRWLATTLAPNIRVNAIVPGGIERGQPESFIRNYASRVPLRRMGREEDIKGAAVFLASDLSAYVTGQCLAVDGGWTAW